ncbi:class I SAM-dependent methyltransferase [Glaciihabitans sp. GrIS 2.15]|uniref:class I SAM-dependent methyltransferase n=1 Tax=Glaciihabitans sp. GrIS 2.15 TaxID=3071710 RepID=UPI002DFF2BD4|nr:SAM-dependent methyltransferase [Glaciihabitans sp. GrIS 2.15]
MNEDARSSLFQSDSIAENYRHYLLPTVFEPWAHHLVDSLVLHAGQTVLDVASGTGAVARAAAKAVGPSGRVIASDISTGMLAEVSVGADPDGALIETLEAPATAIPLEDDSVDVVLCQHGLPFVRDQVAAMAEMKRVLRPGGSLGIVVWVAALRLEPFDSYGDVLRDEGLDEPFPRAWDFDSFKMTRARLTKLLAAFEDVTVQSTSLRLDWPSVADAVNGIFGTPYGPVLTALMPEKQQHALSALRDWMTASPHPLVTAFVATASA